jgi:hypothetical protein
MPQRKGSARTRTSTGGNRAGNQTPNTPNINETELGRLKVAELREQLSERGVTGTSRLRKDDLVKTLVKTMRDGNRGTGTKQRGSGASKKDSAAGGIRKGAGNSRSLRYAQEIRSTDDEPERPGRSLVTTNHDVIRQWAEEREAKPATITGTEHEDRAGVLRFDFPGGSEGGRLRQIGWDEWFATFDERRLNFIYQQNRSDGRQSNFFRLENPDREDA